jgi:hypothetical protein
MAPSTAVKRKGLLGRKVFCKAGRGCIVALNSGSQIYYACHRLLSYPITNFAACSLILPPSKPAKFAIAR